MRLARAQLDWLCRRGSRELDLLLRTYLERAYEAATQSEQEAFVRLLDKQDPELQALLFGKAGGVDRALDHLLDRIRAVAAPDR